MVQEKFFEEYGIPFDPSRILNLRQQGMREVVNERSYNVQVKNGRLVLQVSTLPVNCLTTFF